MLCEVFFDGCYKKYVLDGADFRIYRLPLICTGQTSPRSGAQKNGSSPKIMTKRTGKRRLCLWMTPTSTAIILLAAIFVGLSSLSFAADEPKADPAGTATGDKNAAVDAAGNPFVVAEPTDKTAPDYAKNKKDFDDYQAQAAKEPLAVKLADDVGHVRVATNFAWTLNTGYLVLFMQAGFALLTCGLVRKKNAAHLMMLNFAAYVFAFLAYYAVGYAFQFGAVAINAAPTNLGGIPTLNHFLIGSGQWGFVGGKGFFFVGPAYDAASNCFTLFEVVFMETAGYIIVGAICERITFLGFLALRTFRRSDPLSDLRMLDLGRRLAVATGIDHESGPRLRRLCRIDRRARRRRILRHGSGHHSRAAAGQVWARREDSRLSCTQHRVRGHRNIHSAIRVDGIQSGIDARRNRSAYFCRRHQYEPGCGGWFGRGDAHLVFPVRQA